MSTPSSAVDGALDGKAPAAWAPPRLLVLAAFWLPLGFCAAVALLPNPTGLAASFSGVGAHMAAFAYLSAALFRAHFERGSVLEVALWLFAFGVVLEVGQLLLVSGRSGELGDLAIDLVGIGVGCAAYCGWMRWRGVKVALAV